MRKCCIYLNANLHGYILGGNAANWFAVDRYSWYNTSWHTSVGLVVCHCVLCYYHIMVSKRFIHGVHTAALRFQPVHRQSSKVEFIISSRDAIFKINHPVCYLFRWLTFKKWSFSTLQIAKLFGRKKQNNTVEPFRTTNQSVVCSWDWLSHDLGRRLLQSVSGKKW
jgi:hypothetical protein